ncbi:Desmoplakin [Dissostichus eleginoides]|uniref:Desmoplakin n=1 Tax=Dissostichus eleginoides TaxID=100907 RepID=A0AAD9CGY1_DISEL|nr:Desmoplakin [Dissostichus eleginoides]
MKDDSTSEALKELMSVQTQAKTEKEEMEAKINEMEEDFNKEKTTWSDLCCQRLGEITSLRTELSDAQSHIDHLKEENAKLMIKDDSTSEALKELMSLQTQAKMEKEELEAKINEMEENFNKEKTTWSDLCCQRLEEITSLRTELSDAQSHNDHLKEENAKLMMKDDSTSEALKELMSLQTQAKTEKEEMEEDFNKEKTTWSDLCCQRLEEITSLRTELSDAQSHINHLKEENAKLTMKDDSTTEALKELMSLQTKAKTEKDEMEEDFNKEKTTWSDLCCQRLEEITSLRTELSDAQSHIGNLKEENVKLKMKDDSTSEALKELMSFQTQAKTEKEEMEAKINEMEEDLNKEKTTWSDLCCQRLEEMTSLRTELSDAQSHIDHLTEENVKLTMKDDSTSEALKELMSLQTQAKTEKDEMEEDFNKEKTTWSDLCCQRLEEITSLRTELSDAQSHIDHLKEENAKLTIKDDSTSEALKELMNLQTQAKTEKEEMEAKINEMEENFNKEKTTWSDLCYQRLEEITSLRSELSDAQSHINHLNEENAKLTMKDESTFEALKELMGLQTQAKTEKEEMEVDFNKEKTTWSDLCCQRLEEITSLRTELSDAQSHIDHLKEENAKLTIKDDRTSEALKELMSIQTQAKTEKDEMEAKMNEMEEDFNKGKASLRTDLSDAQSHINHLNEENAKLTMKDDSTSEALKELMSLQTQAKMQKDEMEEDFNKEKNTWSDLCCQRLEEITSLRTELSDAQSHIDHLKEENAKQTMKDDSTSKALKELMSLQTQAKMEKDEMEEDFNKEKTTWSDLCCQRLEEITSLRTELSDAQSHIDHLKEENAKQKMKDDSTSEALKELMSLQTQAKMLKEELEAKINEMEEDLNKEKTTWSDLCCQRLEEMTSLRTELSDAQSHIDHLKEENAKQTMKDDSTSEALKELMSLQTQAKTEKDEMEEDFNKEKTTWSDLCCQRLEEITSLRTELSDAQSHIDHLKEENAKLTIKDDRTSEALKELMSIQTQAKTEKEEMEAKMNEMEEDFNKGKASLRTDLSDAQSHINHLNEENAKLTMKDDSTSEALKELMSIQTQAKTQKDEMEEDFNKEKTTWSDLCCQRLEEITSLRTELSDAQSHINHLKEENAKQTMKDDSTSEALNELMSLQTQAKTEKEEMEAKMNEMEEDLNKEKTTWSDLCCQRLEEISSLRTELSDVQSHIGHLKEENVKLKMKDESTSEALKELMGLQTQAKTEKEEMEVDFNKEKTTWSDLCCQRLEEITSLRTELSDAQSHIDHQKEENAKLTMKDDSTSEALKELMSIQTQAKTEKDEMEAKMNEMEEDFNKGKASLRTDLSDAQSHINHLNEENAKLTMKDDSTSEALKELMSLQTQAKTEKEEMEEDFNKEKTTWSDLCCQRLEEITSLRTELSDAQSHINHLKEENAKLTMKDDSTSEALKELMSLRTQAKMEKEEMEAKMNEMEEDLNKEKTTWSDLCCQRLEEISSLRTELSDVQSHIGHLKEENVKLKMKDDSTSEALKELMSLQTQAKTEKDEMEEDFNKEKTTWSDLCCQRLEEITSLRTELSDAQSHINHLKEENAKLTIKDDSTSEAFKELMSLQTQAKTEKEELEAKINEMEENFNKENTTWSDLCCQRLEEMTSLRTELSDAQSHIDHQKEENAKLTIKDESTSEALNELMSLQTQAKTEKDEMEEDFNKEKTTWSDLCCQRLEEITSLRTELSDAQSHINHLNEENAKLTMKDDSTSEALKELMSLQTQAKTEKDEMEEDFNKEKTTWSDLCCQRLEEITSLRTELSDAQSHIDHLKEENAKLTMKDESTSEALKDLMGLQTQAKTEKEEMEETLIREDHMV